MNNTNKLFESYMINLNEAIDSSNYVVFNKRDRLIFDLNSKKKKEKFMNYFCHDTKKSLFLKELYMKEM